jgi:hypothetical protein
MRERNPLPRRYRIISATLEFSDSFSRRVSSFVLSISCVLASLFRATPSASRNKRPSFLMPVVGCPGEVQCRTEPGSCRPVFVNLVIREDGG